MWRYVFFVVSISLTAISVPKFLDRNKEAVNTAATIARDQIELQAARSQTAKDAAEPAALSGTVRVPRDRQGHYVGDFRLNNARVEGLIDTGASTIAINRTTARLAGLDLRDSDFIYRVETANGQTSAARAVIANVRIGSIRVSNVEAMVLEDRALNSVLIGMSFMNRLRKFEYANGSLVLRR